jgi:hypothetical protein
MSTDASKEPTVMWTVYDHPTDYPNNFVARKFLIGPNQVIPQLDTMICPDVEMIRDRLRAMGLVKLMRSDGDDPVIMETWI